MAKQIKGNAATVAAGKKQAAPRSELTALVDGIREAQKSVAMYCYDTAIWCRTNNATESELKLVKAVATRQQWADMNKIITCAHKLPASAPKNLVKLAQYIRALDKGATPAMAKKHADGKLNASELKQEIATKNGESLPEPADAAPKGKGAQKRNDEANPWELYRMAMVAFEKQYGADCPDVGDILNDAYDALKAATAEADDVEIDEAA